MFPSPFHPKLELVFVFGVCGVFYLVCVLCFLEPKMCFGLQEFSIWTIIVLLFHDIVDIYCTWSYNFLINIGYSGKGHKIHG